MADLQRSIPSMVDGLKPGQRKILFCSFKRNFVKEAKVAQFSGYVSEHSAYHHGEASLQSTIIGMAQDFVGSNNINFMKPNGQFGTRHQGGKDHASARYVFTCLSPITRFLFPKEDDVLLDYLNEDGQSIEPTWYVPIVPTVLINGSEGIGTGWSSYIPNYNPRDIIANIKHLLNDDPMEPMDPWYKGFKGLIEKTATKETGVSYTVTGIIEEINETTVRITELPIRRWTQDYKEFLESIMTGNDKIFPFIKDYKEHNDDTTVDFEVIMSEESLLAAKQEGLLKKFKLTTSISTSNMHLFDAKGVIKKYDTPEQILEEFFHLRLELYEKRKKVLLENIEMELLKLSNKVRFILGVVNGEIIVNNRKRSDLFQELHKKGFTPFPKKGKAVEVAVAGATEGGDENEENSDIVGSQGIKASDYDYLLSMAIGTLTLEKVQELIANRDQLEGEVDELKKATPKSMWLKDLEALENQLDEQDMNDHRTEETRKEFKRQVMKEAGMQVPRQPPKNPRKNNTKKSIVVEPITESVAASNSSATDIGLDSLVTENVPVPVPEGVKPKAKAGTRKAPAKKQGKVKSVDSDDDEILDLKDRLAAYNLESSPELSTEMETEATKAAPAQGKKQPGKRGASKTTATTKKRGKANNQPPALLNPKLITEILKPAENAGVSPQKKVRKMRASPFNKKSGSMMGRVGGISTIEELSPASEDSNGESEVQVDVVPPPSRPRPQRATRGKTTYVISDSESEEEPAGDSDFEDNEEDSD